ncbi:GDYXXLXY domain-containing protein [Pedobacter psychroterrae]|uniref:Membrane-anchored protein n=1 Tax=Pedobacter psychroterrae TaxID=2530453 RepID=A0A4R0NP10_9SPHI|nr:GDYXXLXY domain-containing protein [Pedobacter psychroterrae]TCD02496.1 hypothetical protein EZ437_00470 [Pedobacter psychroterrae]
MNKVKGIVILVNLVLLLGYINWSIAAKEKTLNSGQLVLLELAPVDPRSLMQGDYMRLNYAIAFRPGDKSKLAKRGYCIVKLDSNKVARFVRYQDKMLPLKAGEQPIKYFSKGSRFLPVNLGAESYFFEEGTGKKYEQAKYGGLMIDSEGNSILTGLYGENFRLIL